MFKTTLICLAAMLSFTLQAQDTCLKVSIVDDQKLIKTDHFQVYLIITHDTIMMSRKSGTFCLPNSRIIKEEAIDVLVVYQDKTLLYPSLFPGFLKLNDRDTEWHVTINKKPFKKEHYPRIKKWRGIYKIETFETTSKDRGTTVMLYKKRKNGSYIP